MILIAAIAVAAVAVAAVAVVVTGDDDSNDSSASSIDSKLLVYGNANNDYTINEDDLTVVQDIIDGNASLSDYPLADANCDGTVDSSDVDLLNQLISRTSGITVYVSCLDRSGNDTAVAVSYPLRNVVTYATNIQMPALYANGADYIIGYFSSLYENGAEKDLVANATDLGGSQRKISDTAWSNFTSLDASTDGGVGALLVDYSGIAQITDARMTDLNDAGIPMISYSSADALTSSPPSSPWGSSSAAIPRLSRSITPSSHGRPTTRSWTRSGTSPTTRRPPTSPAPCTSTSAGRTRATTAPRRPSTGCLTRRSTPSSPPPTPPTRPR
jgi:hypothetical protein